MEINGNRSKYYGQPVSIPHTTNMSVSFIFPYIVESMEIDLNIMGNLFLYPILLICLLV